MLTSILFATAHSQNITPLQNSEQCPGINILFTVTLPAQSIQNIQPWPINVNPIVVQQPYNFIYNGNSITFNFIGKFSDNNNNQTFRFFYTDQSGMPTTWDATFSKIKSLLTSNPYSQIFPAPGSITTDRCQIQDFDISFSNVQYGNIYVQLAIGYGTITDYEYLLPVGWKLNNGTPSDGVTWQVGDNNVTVTSDLSHGDGESIQ
ncbi:MAG: hypothetical protein KDB92_12630, partial [Chitinophagaceae bacterium]|nr:hypothetical protein [Chitinophagaceae bacterium]